MPPVMGIAAFLMAEFLGVDYFDVVARGWVPALIYFISVSTFGLSAGDLLPHPHGRSIQTPNGCDWRDKVNIGAFVVRVGGLVDLMAAIFLAPHFAALDMFCVVRHRRCWLSHIFMTAQKLVAGGASSSRCSTCLDSYIDMITDIALLLATLSIMTGALVITGVPTKLGFLLVEAAGVNIAAMVGMGFIFGAILGTGLPPAPVYILVAIVIGAALHQGRRSIRGWCISSPSSSACSAN